MAVFTMIQGDTVANFDAETKIATVAIVGGGKAGLQLYSQFRDSSLARVVYMVDRDKDAPAIIVAREKKIPTYTDYKQGMAAHTVDFIFEVTGSAKVAEMLREALGDNSTQLVTHDMAFILLKVMEENRKKTTTLVCSEISAIKDGISTSLQAMDSTISDIKHTMSNLSLLSINARIEAAHAGDRGRGFDIVAQHVESSAGSVRDMIKKIEDVNANILDISQRIEESLRKLA